MDIVPRPVAVEELEGQFVLTPNTIIVAEAAAKTTAEQLANWLRPATGYALPVAATDGGPAITLRLDSSAPDIGDEGYTLSVQPAGVTLTARTRAGLFYAA